MSTSTDTLHAALEDQFGLADRVVDEAALAASVERFRERGIVMPTHLHPGALGGEVARVRGTDEGKPPVVEVPGAGLGVGDPVGDAFDAEDAHSGLLKPAIMAAALVLGRRVARGVVVRHG